MVSRHGAPLLRALRADSFLARLRGLHAVAPLGPGDALLISPCRAVQTWRMDYAVDVVFLDEGGNVLALHPRQRGTVAICWGAQVAIEMAAGTAERLGLGVGQTLTISRQVRAS